MSTDARVREGGRADGHAPMMSVCGVMCSQCPAYHAGEKGPGYQRRVVEAWRRIYGLSEIPKHITCGGCLGSDEALFHSSRHCRARRCCRSKGFANCAECPEPSCADLEAAQKVWDEVPALAESLPASDFDSYARAYCGHRERLAGLRAALRGPRLS